MGIFRPKYRKSLPPSTPARQSLVGLGREHFGVPTKIRGRKSKHRAIASNRKFDLLLNLFRDAAKEWMFLECLTFEQFVEGEGTLQYIKRTLENLKTKIIKLSKQCSIAFRGAEHHLSHLRRAVVGQPWSERPLQVSHPIATLISR
jgi:hypothetical protein